MLSNKFINYYNNLKTGIFISNNKINISEIINDDIVKEFYVLDIINIPVLYLDILKLLLSYKIIKNISIYCFTDGSSSNNGKPNATAKGGVYIKIYSDDINIFEDILFSRNIEPFEYEFDGLNLINNKNIIQPSNNRGELMGMLLALCEVDKICKIDKSYNNIKIISDSNYCINTLNTFYPNRLKNNTSHELSNSDMLKLLHEINIKYKIEYIHINSHKKIPINSEIKINGVPEMCRCIINNNDCCKTMMYWYGNDKIDKFLQ